MSGIRGAGGGVQPRSPSSTICSSAASWSRCASRACLRGVSISYRWRARTTGDATACAGGACGAGVSGCSIGAHSPVAASYAPTIRFGFGFGLGLGLLSGEAPLRKGELARGEKTAATASSDARRSSAWPAAASSIAAFSSGDSRSRPPTPAKSDRRAESNGAHGELQMHPSAACSCTTAEASASACSAMLGTLPGGTPGGGTLALPCAGCSGARGVSPPSPLEELELRRLRRTRRFSSCDAARLLLPPHAPP